VKAGPKKPVDVPALDLTHLPDARAERRIAFVDEFVIVPKGVGAGESIELRDFQREIIRGAFGDGIRTALVSVPRANGKSALAAALAVAELFAGPASAEVLVVASDQRQANIVLRLARRMIELNPLLAERTLIYADRLVVPETDSTMIALPADPAALHGWDPSLLIVDELHVVTEPVWEAVTSMTGKRPESLTLAISTPSTSPDCIMWRLVEHGRSGEDPAFYLREFSAPDGCTTEDVKAWEIANPALSCHRPFLTVDGMAAARRTLREPVFRQLRLGQWVTGVDQWLPFGLWSDLTDATRVIPDKAKVVLAFDGSASGDSTALIGCTIGPDPHLFVAGLWENPGDPRWRVPRLEVDQCVDASFARWTVLELAADPWGWRTELEAWASRHGEKRVIEWNTAHAGRMGPATDRMYAAAVDHGFSHDGDHRLAAHIAHCVAKATANGDLVTKDKRNSPRKIDAAVAAIVALDRAAWHTNNSSRRRAVSFR
jgi:phage terminase large subunit-like protein